MATFFTKVPREIRDNVYQELLRVDDILDPDKRLQKSDIPSQTSKSTEKLYPAILRACKQTEAEGSVVLYGQNRFRFETTSYFDTHPILSHYYGMIKHLEVNFTRKMYGGEYHNRTIDVFTIKNFLGCVADLGCSLKTLRLRLWFTKHLPPTRIHDDAIRQYEVHLMNEFIQNKELQSLLAALNVETEISIVLKGSFLTYHRDLAVFLGGIAQMKGWTIKEHQPRKYEGPGTKLSGRPRPPQALRLRFTSAAPPVATNVNGGIGASNAVISTWTIKPVSVGAGTYATEAIGSMTEGSG